MPPCQKARLKFNRLDGVGCFFVDRNNDGTYVQGDCLTLPKRQILDSSKLKDFADDNLKFDENDIKFCKRVKNISGKEEIAHYW